MILRQWEPFSFPFLAPQLFGNVRPVSVLCSPLLLISFPRSERNIGLGLPIRFLGTNQTSAITGLSIKGWHKIVRRQCMALYTMGLREVRLCKDIIASALRSTIDIIVGPCSQEQVSWIDAGGIVASVQDTQPVWNRTVMQNPRRTMGSNAMSTVQPEAPISKIVFCCSGPIPTIRHWINYDLFQQSLFRLFPSHTWKDNAVAV